MSLAGAIAQREGTLLPRAREDQVDSLVQRVRLSLDFALPEEYRAFLRQSNGAAIDGLLFYPTDGLANEGFDLPGLVDINLRRREYRDGLQNLLILGEVDDDFIVYRAADATFLRIDRLALDSYREAKSLAELTEMILAERGR